MSVFGIFPKKKRQSRKHLYCRVFVALFFTVLIGAIIARHIIDAHADNDPVPSVNLSSQHVSYTDKEPGAWRVDKAAGWTGPGEARIIFNVNSLAKLPDKGSDILLVVNRGSSDEDDKFEVAKDALKSLVNNFLDDGDNTIALVTFGHTYSIETDFTDNRDLLLSKINDIQKTYGCNLYQGLNGAERVLNSYVHNENRSTIVVILTNKEATEEVLYQASEYRLIKLAYPYVTINAIQYRLGEEIISSLTTISENRYAADENNIGDVIFDASVAPYDYERFIITDYIDDDYFSVDDIDSIDASMGLTTLESENGTPKITWDLSQILQSGSAAEMTINIKLKPEYVEIPGLYSTNKRTTVSSVLPEVAEENTELNITPILKTDYKITYLANSPSDCVASGVPAEEVHYVYETIPFPDMAPTCNGYIFKGWKIADSHLAQINDDYFIMPDIDLRFLAIWSKPTITKTADGTVHIVQTLYDAIAQKSLGEDNKYNLDGNISFNYTVTSSDIGVKTIKSTANDEFPVHYFRGNVSDNNILFADTCWKAVRTTSTGGVKLLYNGEALNSRCEDSRPNHIGYGESVSKNLSNNYYYGTDYVYDETDGTFRLSGVKTLAKWDDSSSSDLVHKYTCMSTDSNAACATMYYVVSKRNSTNAYVAQLKNNIHYAAIASTQFNSSDAYISSVGYMFGDDPGYSTLTLGGVSQTYSASLFPSTSLNTSYWYADSITYDTDGSLQYGLVDPYKVSSTSEYSNLIGKYTFRNSSNDYHNNFVYYIVGTYGSTMYYIQLEQGQLIPGENEYIVIGDGFEDNGDGTYTLINPVYIEKSQWGMRYNEASGKFICGVGSTLCSTPRYIYKAEVNKYNYISASQKIVVAKTHDGLTLQDTIKVRLYELIINHANYSEYRYTCGDTTTICTPKNFVYISSYSTSGYSYYYDMVLGASVTWNGNNYTLVDTIDSSGIESGVRSHHFACESMSQTVCEKVRFFYDKSGSSISYVVFENGITTVDEFFEKIFENKYDSAAKSMNDAWYRRTLVDYASMLEDTPFCSDRRVYDWGGWDATGGRSLETAISFIMKGRHSSPTINCARVSDSFSVDTSNGNGALIYPVGLLSADEAIMAGSTTGCVDGNVPNYKTFISGPGTSWTMTPASHHPYNSYVYYWNRCSRSEFKLSNNEFVRPVISIKPGIYIADGDGSVSTPWTLVEY